MSALPGKVDASVVEILLGNKMTDSRAEGAIEPREFQLPLVPVWSLRARLTLISQSESFAYTLTITQ
jgi:hypothetical protein